MTYSRPPIVYGIPASASFLHELAAGILKRFPHETLHYITVFLPNNRSCRMLEDVLELQARGQALLMPKIIAIADVEDDNFGVKSNSARIVSNYERQLVWKNWIIDWFSQKDGILLSENTALQLAKQLSKMANELHRFGKDFADVNNAIPDELAEHWQMNWEFLFFLEHQWQAWLEQHNAIDPIKSRTQAIVEQATFWKNSEPDNPVILAGTTASTPATMALLASLAHSKNGHVVIANYSPHIPEIIEENHPLFGLSHVLETLNVHLDHVRPWHDEMSSNKNWEACWQQVFLPQQQTAEWAHTNNETAKKLSQISLIEGENEEEEAAFIAMLVRDQLEDPYKSVGIVTQDLALLERIKKQLTQWNIFSDNTIGQSFLSNQLGQWLTSSASILGKALNPKELMAWLAHPWATLAFNTNELTHYKNLLHKEYEGVLPKAAGSFISEEKKHDLNIFIKRINYFINAIDKKSKHAFIDWFKQHIDALKYAMDEQSFEAMLVSDVYLQLNSIIQQAGTTISPLLQKCSWHEYTSLLQHILSSETYRPAFLQGQGHVAIFAPMEARLVSFDTVILAGMNENIWPRHSHNPWISKPCEEALGLLSEKKQYGIAAHDFYSIVTSAKQVFLTRSKKQQGKSANPSPWWMRILAFAKANGIIPTEKTEVLSSWLKQFNDHKTPANIITQAPYPKPPKSARPNSFYATQLDRLMEDPYAYYAKHILKLTPREAIDREVDSRDFGNMLHHALEHWVKEPNKSEACFLEHAHNYQQQYWGQRAENAVWLWRAKEIYPWLEQEYKAISPKSSLCEHHIQHRFTIDGEEYLFGAYIDRIDLFQGGKATIIDYKTAEPPNKSSILSGKKGQLGMYAWLWQLQHPNSKVEASFWHIKYSASNCQISTIIHDEKSAEEVLQTTEERTKELLRHFANDDNGYMSQPWPLPEQKRGYKLSWEYEHLSRYDAWKNEV